MERPKGATGTQPNGNALGFNGNACGIASKRQKLLPFQGVCRGCTNTIPRVLPWAMSLLAFQAVVAKQENNNMDAIITWAKENFDLISLGVGILGVLIGVVSVIQARKQVKQAKKDKKHFKKQLIL